MTTFKEGDKVYDGVHYPGKEGLARELYEDQVYVIGFSEDHQPRYFNNGARCGINSLEPTLSKVPYTFQLPEQPHEFKEGDPVLVRDEDYCAWFGTRIFKVHKEGTFRFRSVDGVGWRQCIPFDIEKLGRV